MYFWEFLETCTIGWVLICEGGVGIGSTNPEKTPFFNFFYARCRPPHPRRSLYAPQVDTPAPSAPGRTTQHRQQHRPCQNQGGASTRADHAHNRPHTAHTPGRWTRCAGLHSIPDRPRRDRSGRRRGAGGRGNTSIMRIVIALSQAWYIDSILYKYHTNVLLHLVIVNYHLSIDIPSY